jgi:hypothetical protein
MLKFISNKSSKLRYIFQMKYSENNEIIKTKKGYSNLSSLFVFFINKTN